MKHQQVSVDYWAMGKAMFSYGILTVLGWMMLRLFNAVFMLPRRLRAQHNNIQHTLQELQRRFPDLNITEEDLKNAEKELEDFIKEEDSKKEQEENSKEEDSKKEQEENSKEEDSKKELEDNSKEEEKEVPAVEDSGTNPEECKKTI